MPNQFWRWMLGLSASRDTPDSVVVCNDHDGFLVRVVPISEYRSSSWFVVDLGPIRPSRRFLYSQSTAMFRHLTHFRIYLLWNVLKLILGSRQATQGRCQVVTPPPRFGFRRKLVRGSYNAPMLIDDRTNHVDSASKLLFDSHTYYCTCGGREAQTLLCMKLVHQVQILSSSRRSNSSHETLVCCCHCPN